MSDSPTQPLAYTDTGDRLHLFLGGTRGPWVVDRQTTVVGDDLAPITRLDVVRVSPDCSAEAAALWTLRGTTSNGRYVTKHEQAQLTAVQASLGRPAATSAAMLPIRKSARWWALAQDERRAIFEERSGHIASSMRFLPAIARRLYHCRDLGEPFDFVTWFEFAPEHASAFDELVGMLHDTEEWKYVDREVDIRLSRDMTAAP